MPSARRAPTDAIVYPADDSVARDLAERIVALARGPTVTARGLAADSFGVALRLETERALRARPPDGRRSYPAGSPPPGRLGATVVPLVETRAVRRAPPRRAGLAVVGRAVRPAEAGDTARAAP